ncbi:MULTISPECIES: tetratricopeptide repeat protein [unclassified Gilliamella]|uniref:tetratricopeptide repeat protein n=1 Tax=unclassified Gilliamella TaxID=2685620 RepID=UPI00226AFA5A|nr:MULTISPECIES: tetratricopeptide repeat protein [unclassified Gilliamella]MCX8582755.1 sel1 repeat family protein [Gilliamella sp. B3372]MCX8594158.1 sel1 repeat family protein [Gilliamella sp. B3367]MCX8675004.1 sel1 repeat family protein [Gilliamella sp. B3023]
MVYVVLTALLSTTAYANNCATYYEQNKFDQAFIACNTEADQGDREAQYNLARMYAQGNRVKVDIGALYWYTKAADNGDTQAMHNLGVMYYKGDGIEKNSDLAKKYFEQACELKFKESCYILHKGMK